MEAMQKVSTLIEATETIQKAEQNVRDNWVLMANTLITVRDEELWEEGGHAGFIQYIEDELGYGKQWAYKLMKTPQVASVIPVTNPSVASEIIALPEEQWEEAWDGAKQIAATNEPSSRHVRRAVKAIKDGRSIEEEIQRVEEKKAPPAPEQTGDPLADAQAGFTDVVQTMIALYNQIKVLSLTPAGVWIDMSHVNADLQNLKNNMKFSKPFAVCPFCGGVGCEKCLNTGFLTEERFKAYSEERE